MSTYLLNPGAQYRKHEGHPQCLSWSDDPPREALAWLDRYMGKLRERAFPRKKMFCWRAPERNWAKSTALKDA